MSTKKLLIAVIVLLVVAGGAFVVYNFFIKEQIAPKTSPTPSAVSHNFKPNIIKAEKILAPVIDNNNLIIKYYLANNGHVVSSELDGTGVTPISITDITNLKSVIWSPDTQKAISVISGTPPQKGEYDFIARRFSPLSLNMGSIAWSPDSNKIAYQYQLTADDSTIAIANADGTNWKNIYSTRLQNLNIEWPTPDKISFYEEPSGKKQGSLLTVNPDSAILSTILTKIYGLAAKWSPDGQKIIYQSTDSNGKNLKLYIVGADGQSAKELPVATLTKKCVWSSDNKTIFCAVPQTLSENAVWPDDYEAGRVAVIKDDFYIIDTQNLTKTKIAQSTDGQPYDAQSLLLSPQENLLFFVNQKNSMLYSIELKL